jgi:hypothetical protein
MKPIRGGLIRARRRFYNWLYTKLLRLHKVVLCDRYQNIFNRQSGMLKKVLFEYHHTTKDSLQNAVGLQCIICTMLLDIMNRTKSLLGRCRDLEVDLSESHLPAKRNLLCKSALTFIEAIRVARWLEIRYVWIESLCIIQDSVEDWEIESALMGAVYYNSRLNIAAAASSNSHGGLFRSRTSFNSMATAANPRWPTFEGREICLLEHNLWHRQLNLAPLNRRAWVLQERILASRVLHFGESQLFWECHELDACEMYPKGIPPFMSKGVPRFKDIDLSIDRAQTTRTSRSDRDALEMELAAYSLWTRIVSAYSTCGLSLEADKLVAVNGLANSIQGVVQDKYVAGLWRKSLHEQLLWCASETGSLTRPKAYCAPTWSWASLDGDITSRPYKGPLMSNVEIINVQVHALENGQVLGGSIFLRGKLFDYSLMEILRPSPLSYTIFRWDIEKPHELDRVVCLQVVGDGVVGLFLRRAPGLEQGTYERVGAYDLSHAVSTRDVAIMLLEADKSPPDLYCIGCPGAVVLV